MFEFFFFPIKVAVCAETLSIYLNKNYVSWTIFTYMEVKIDLREDVRFTIGFYVQLFYIPNIFFASKSNPNC